MKHILITGASGALGSALVPLFAGDAETRVVLLMRAQSPEHLAQRRERILSFLRLLGMDEPSTQRVDFVQGDISQATLGLAAEPAERLVGNVTHVVHSAGNVKLNQSLDDARKTAVGSAKGIVDFVRRCQHSGQFKKLEFVSTVGVAGRKGGLISEERVSEDRSASEFHNTYEAAKWEAERFLWREIDDGLPATVHRPSMIVGDSQNGTIFHFQVFYFLTDFLIGRRTWGVIPRTDGAVLDIVPVDYVAKAIHLASREQLGMGQVWHLCSGPEDSWPLERLLEKLRELLAERGERVPTTRSVPLSMFRHLLGFTSTFAPPRSRRFLKGLPFLLDYLDEKQLFEHERTNLLLREQGLAVPAVESYLKTIMTPYWDRTVTSTKRH